MLGRYTHVTWVDFQAQGVGGRSTPSGHEYREVVSQFVSAGDSYPVF